MPGKPRSTSKRRLEAIGLAPLENLAQQIKEQALEADHPLQLPSDDVEAMKALAELPTEEYRAHMINTLKLNTAKIASRIAHEVENIPARHLPIAYSILTDKLRDLMGEPTQRIEIRKQNLTPEDFNAMLKQLPEADTVEVETKPE